MDTTCELIHCQECGLGAELEKLKKEIQVTRDYIHDHNLEWDLMSYSKRKERQIQQGKEGEI